jgi:hypothetical protein
LYFQKKSFHLFGFGSKLLVASLYSNAEQCILFVSVDYPTASLGYYTRAKTFADVSAGTIVAVLQQATFQFLV